MPLNFPSNPSLNQTSTQNGRVYRWSGSAWEFASVSPAEDARWSLFAPPAPTSLTATPGNAQASLSWSAPTVLAQTPITDYIVQYSANSGSSWTTFSDGTSTSTSATVTGLTNSTAYVFRVAAANGAGTGAYTAASASVTPIDVPAAPTSLTATAGNEQVSLTWTAPAVLTQTITDYVVQYKTVAASTWTTFSDGVSTTTSATITGLTSGVAYLARVAAVNPSGTGAFATSSEFTPTGTPTDPYFSSVVLLNHFEGANNTVISPANGSSNFLTTSQKQFGDTSLRLLNPDNGSVTPSPLVTLNASGNLVVECWLRMAPAGDYSDPTSATLSLTSSAASENEYYNEEWGGQQGFLTRPYTHLTTTSKRGLFVRVKPDGIQAGVEYDISGRTASFFGAANFDWQENTWYYIAWVRSGGYWSFYVNGNKLTNTVNNQDTTTYNAAFDYAGYNSFLDELRITVGTDRGYTGATIPVPIAPFPDA